MCGIVGFVSREQPFGAGPLERAAASLRHRGPDALRTWRSVDGRAGLGHARLSIIDLVTGDQPIANEDGWCRIVANGEFYDFEAIQRELVARGHVLATRSDSEVALHLYEEGGVDCLHDLRGEFAFAIWDDRRERLFAARDRFGIKPLYYAVREGVLILASEIKALAAAGVPLRWSHAGVAQSLYAMLTSELTLFEGVWQVPPGHHLVATREGYTVTKYWDLDYPRLDGAPPSRSDDEWISAVREQVVEAVRLRLRADVPIGCLLSGGLDSSSALGIARHLGHESLKAFTIAFDEAAYDESARARETAAYTNAEFVHIPVTNRDFADVFADAVWHAEGFLYNGHGPARFLLSREVRKAGIKVVLAGEGGDELSAGYRFCEKTLGVEGPVPSAGWPRELLELFATVNPSAEKIRAALPVLEARAKEIGFPESTFGASTRRSAAANGLLDADFVARWCRPDMAFDFFRQYDVAGQLDGREPSKQALYLWMKSGFANYVLNAERLDMAHAVEQRVPFLDHKLVELMRAAPGSLLWRHGREKWILREALRPFVTEAVYAGKKQPFSAPRSALQDGSPMLTLAQDVLRSEAAARVPFLDQRGVIALMDRLPTMAVQERAKLDSTVLLMLSMAVLQQRYGL